jgi:hypothetical protein
MKLHWLRYCVQVGWQVSQERGWRNVQPILRYRAVVSNDSHLFALLEGLVPDKLTLNTATREQIFTKCREVSVILTCSLGYTVCPEDVNEYGQTLLHVFTSCPQCKTLLTRTGGYGNDSLALLNRHNRLSACLFYD